MVLLYAGMTIQNIVHRYSDTLIRIAFHNIKSMTDAEDIVQDVYIKLIKHQGKFNNEEHLKAWLIKATYHRCKDLFRSSWFRRVIPMHENIDILALEEESVMEEIFSLKRDDRIIIYLNYYEGYSISEIASMLGKNKNTISSRLQRARKRLKHLIEEGGR